MAQLTAADVERWLRDRQWEHERLEFKRQPYGRGDEARRELPKDITAMANAEGGIIAIGIVESNHRAESVQRVADPVAEGEWMQGVVRDCVYDRLHGLRTYPVTLSDGQQVLVVEVPNSLGKPHMAVHSKHQYLYRRIGTSNSPRWTPSSCSG